jgi:Nucleotidyl transferase AbiEii toxin, Type IV TA system
MAKIPRELRNSKPVDLRDLRRLVIIAMFADDFLMERLVLKGGNALALAHGIELRSSIEIDLSMSGDFDDLKEVEQRMLAALQGRFQASGLAIFDFRFIKKPENAEKIRDSRWGGYVAEFKVTDLTRYQALQNDIEALRRGATTVGPDMKRVFTVEISKHEYCEPKTTVELDNYTIYVYTLPMIAIEKLRAICQQLPEYELRGYQTPRARDFFDIYSIVTERNVDLTNEANRSLIRPIFEAKKVPTEFLDRIANEREFHRADWPSVVASARDELKPFDFYFDFVLKLIGDLKTAGIE